MKSNVEGTGPVTNGGADQDAQLLDRVRRGDEQAMGAIYDRYSKIVYSVALRVLRDSASAEDVLQDVATESIQTSLETLRDIKERIKSFGEPCHIAAK